MSLWRIATIFPCKDNKVSSSPTEKNINTVKKSVSASCQMDIDQPEMEELVRNVARLKINWKQSSSKQSHFSCVFAKLQLFRPFPFLSIHSIWNACLSPLGSSVVLVILMHLSMSSRWGGRRGRGRDFDIFQKIAVKFPTPGQKFKVKYNYISHPKKWFVVTGTNKNQISLPTGQQENSNALPLG